MPSYNYKDGLIIFNKKGFGKIPSLERYYEYIKYRYPYLTRSISFEEFCEILPSEKLHRKLGNVYAIGKLLEDEDLVSSVIEKELSYRSRKFRGLMYGNFEELEKLHINKKILQLQTYCYSKLTNYIRGYHV